MANQLFTDGDVKVVDDQELECVGVTYVEFDGERSNFVYSFRLKSELDQEREIIRRGEEAAAEGARLAEENAKPVEGDQ